MIALLLLAIVPVAGNASTRLPCLPVASAGSAPAAPAIEDHRTLRKALGEPMPQKPMMVMLHGKGGHLSTEEYSIIVVRSADGSWRGTAVGRSRILVKDAPYSPMKRAEWMLDTAAALQLDDAIADRCASGRDTAETPAKTGPPPRGFLSERIDVVLPGQDFPPVYSKEQADKIAALIRPPR